MTELPYLKLIFNLKEPKYWALYLKIKTLAALYTPPSSPLA